MQITTNKDLDFIKKRFIELLRDYEGFENLSKEEKRRVSAFLLENIFEETKFYLTRTEKEELLNELLENVVFGLRQLQQYQDDPKVEEIMINGLENVFIKKRMVDGYIKVPVKFKNRNELTRIIEKLLEGTGRRVDRSRPLVDLRLVDGSRCNIVVEPLSVNGPYITIRKFPEKPISMTDLLNYGTLSEEMLDFFKTIIKNRLNIIVAGGTAAGKTTLLSALLRLLVEFDKKERIIVIEDTAEITLPKELINQVRLETRPPTITNAKPYTIRDLIKNSLRMRPDRIVVGEIRSGEAFDMLQAMNSGHPGSLSTVHANSSKDTVDRLKALVLQAGFSQLPMSAIVEWISKSIDVIIYLKKHIDGKRRIMEVVGMTETGKIEPIFLFNKDKNIFEKQKFFDKYQKMSRL